MNRLRPPLILLVLGLAVVCLFSLRLPATAAAPEFSVRFQPFVDGLVEPIGIAHAGDDRLFVVERRGKIRLIDANGQLSPTPFLDISDRVSWESFWEMGLLSLAFHPNYASSGVFFVNYTNLQGHTHISRFHVRDDDPNQADPDSEVILLIINQPTVLHNGGGLAFGPDGNLYIGLGDGGWLGDPNNRAQNLSTKLGKVLRIFAQAAGPAPAFTVPEGNPFVDVPGAQKEIWALGFRNPWRLSFDRETGDLFIADVGNFRVEEINHYPAGQPGGRNFGWRCFEGRLAFNPDGCGPAEEYTFPIHEYMHGKENCAVIGGYVYRGSDYPVMEGTYLFSDFCSREVWGLHHSGGRWHSSWHGRAPAGLSSFGEGVDGELYAVSQETGQLFRLHAGTAGGAFLPQMAHNPLIPTPTPVPDGPDLVIQDVTLVPSQPAPGQPVIIYVTAQNVGNQPVTAGNNFYIDLYVDRLPAPMLNGDISWGAQGVAFGPGDSVNFSAVYTFSGGSHTIYVQADTDNNVPERYEDNNIFGPLPVTVP